MSFLAQPPLDRYGRGEASISFFSATLFAQDPATWTQFAMRESAEHFFERWKRKHGE
jgi:hypothetical protein